MTQTLHRPTRRTLLIAAGTALLVCAAHAQDPYPAKPITIVVPYPAGGSNDLFARIVGKALGDSLKQTVIIDNRPGASGNTGTGQVAKAAADGYTLVAVSSSMTTNAAIQPKIPFDPVKSFAPVAMFAKGPFIVAVNNTFPARTPAELIAELKARPGKYNYASSGLGSSNQFATEMLKAATATYAVHVPYRGMAPAVTDLIGNQAQHHAEIVPRLHEALKARTAIEWELLFGADVPCAAARTVEDMFDHAQVHAEQLVATVEHPTLGSYRGFTRPIKYGRTPGPKPFAAPTLGQHTEVVLGTIREPSSDAR